MTAEHTSGLLAVGGELQAALAASGTGTWRWDAATGVVRWDETLEALSGLQPGEFGGTFDAWIQTLHPDEVDGILEQVDEAIEDRSSYHFEHRAVWPDGSVHWLECRGQVVSAEDGTFLGTVGCAVDITERHAADEERAAALERERRLRDRLEFLVGLTDSAVSLSDHEAFMRSAAAAAVPKLGDWCSIHFVPEPGGTVQTAVAHADPAKVAWANALAERFPYNPDAPTGVANVIRTGTTEFLQQIDESLIDEAVRRADADPAELRSIIDVLGLTSVITVPLTTKRGVLGAMQFVSAESGCIYDTDDVALAEVAASRIADALDNMWLTQQHRHISATLQRALLPPAMPEIPGIDLAVRYWPAGAAVEAGGDFYDVFPLGSDRWSVLVGDVCGTGPDAAALTGIARHTVRAAARHGQDPLSVLEWLNEAMLHSNRDRFCTATYTTLEANDGEWHVTTCAAGHPRPLHVDADASATIVGQHGSLLGAFETIKVRPAELTLHAGDVLVFYTDGMTDLPPPFDQTEEDMAALVARHAAEGSAEQIAEALHRSVTDRLPQGEHQDDVALVVLRVLADPT